MARTFDTPKGTRDFLPDEMRLRTAVFERLVRAFRLFGFDELDTPAFEYLEVLTLKAGPEAEREIYAFDDKGGRRLGLRFDLTSSTGRVMAAHPELKRPVYRYQIGKVWRYDRPAHGRYREFYQADADILGSYSMDCEVDLLLLCTHVLSDFGLTDYQLVLNSRLILEAQVRHAGLPPHQKADALRALDKLDKVGEAGVRQEAARYGLDGDRFAAFLAQLGIDQGSRLGGRDYLLFARDLLAADESGRRGVEELLYILEAAEALGFADRLVIDATLARGLDYYTGPIFEARARVGGTLLSFAGGGRYDDLIALYGGSPQGAVGFSFGVERLIDLLREQGKGLEQRPAPVLVAPVGGGRLADAEVVAMALRQAGVAVRLGVGTGPTSSKPPSPGRHLQYAEACGIEWVIFVGEREVATGQYPLRRLSTRTEELLSLAELTARLVAWGPRAGS
ncbi:MAG: histidine--tRNA ligase [Myxococcales bacterium]|nr:histidine--tRNA ligase [Myxococcales bacterium]